MADITTDVDYVVSDGFFSVRHSWEDLPCYDIADLDHAVDNALTGPDLGFQRILLTKDRSSLLPYVAGTNNWSRANDSFYGISMSLYDQNPITRKITADPNADCFGLCKRGNNSVMVICDGINRGNKPRMAARSAVYGALRYINAHCFEQGESPTNTHEIFKLLNDALNAAHETILKHVHWCTTICIAFVVPLKGEENLSAVCAINVGDSYAFIAKKQPCLINTTENDNTDLEIETQPEIVEIEELTMSSHDFTKDLGRETGGAIGPVDSKKDDPLLSNLTFSMGFARPGDLVFLTTDGVSDNFDPAVQKIGPFAARPAAEVSLKGFSLKESSSLKKDPLQETSLQNIVEEQSMCLLGDTASSSETMPKISLKERHLLSLRCMEQCLNRFSSRSGEVITASSLCGELMRHALIMSQDKRAILEDPEIYQRVLNLDKKSIESIHKSPNIKSRLANARGKMDHASICAVTVAGVEEEKGKIKSTQQLLSLNNCSYRDLPAFSRSFSLKKKFCSNFSLHF